MPVYEREFFRKGLPYKNAMYLTLQLDTDTGALTVWRHRTSDHGRQTESMGCPVSTFRNPGYSAHEERRHLDVAIKTMAEKSGATPKVKKAKNA